MSTPGPAAELLGKIVYELTLIQPFIPTYLHLLLSALFPIYTGAHASLSRPKSAAQPVKRTSDSSLAAENEENEPVEADSRMEGLSPIDAILYPVLAGCMLGGLYFLLKWLNNPEMLNTFLNWYLSLFGVLSITKLLTDSMNTLISFIFPARYSRNGRIWDVEQKQRKAVCRTSKESRLDSRSPRSSPLPGLFSQLPVPRLAEHALWAYRDFVKQPLCIIEFYLISIVEIMIPVSSQDILGIITAFAAVLYFNLADKPWWLTNILGFGFSYSALQLMSPTTCWTGTLVLTSLFFYDIYFVFFTPVMITVATNLDIPVKLLFPRPSTAEEDPSKVALSMLGLGDVVIPGMMIGFALRFDLYLFYLKKQTQPLLAPKGTSEKEHRPEGKIHSDEAEKTVVKARYQTATGSWGERFWLAPQDRPAGSAFPKTYFYATIVGYTTGMLTTLSVMHIYHHGQPALLYLVPGVLGSLWMTAFAKGDLKLLWEYTEADDEAVSKGQENSLPKNEVEPNGNAEDGGSGKDSEEDINSQQKSELQHSLSDIEGESRIKKYESKPLSTKRVVGFSISIPRKSAYSSSTQGSPIPIAKPIGILEGVYEHKPEDFEESVSASSSTFSASTSLKPRTFDGRKNTNEGPTGKRQRLE